MILWFTGNSGSGKSRASQLVKKINDDVIILDGDELRLVWNDLGFSKEDRYKQNIRVARLAKLLNDQGKNVVVAVIAPYLSLRKEIKEICGCEFIYLSGGQEPSDKYPYEKGIC